MSAGLVMLDIGATLVTGPARGPASRIAELAGLDATQKALLQQALMTSPFESAREVVEHGASICGAPAARLERAVREIWRAQQEEARQIEGAATALRDLAGHGLTLALVSNIWQPYLDSVRRHLGPIIDQHVAPELQLYSFRERVAKPADEMFLRALARGCVNPADAVMVGDSYSEDIAPANALGIATVWVLHRPQREAPELQRVLSDQAAYPSLIISSIAELTGELVSQVLARSRRSVRV